MDQNYFSIDESLYVERAIAGRVLFNSIKRCFDILASVILLVILFPLSCLVALLHLLESTGSLFFVQKRVGYGGAEFRLMKYRTMVMDAEKDGPRFAEPNDCRVTRIGRFMRVFRIDEVPQLFNVIKGEMSLVGPRPERPEFIEMLSEEIPQYRMRLTVKPGLTGWAQVNFPYAGDIVDHHREKLEFDLFYIKNRGIFLDAKAIFKTVGIVLNKKGT